MVKPSASSRLAERASVSNSGEVMGAMWLGFEGGSSSSSSPERGGGPPAKPVVEGARRKCSGGAGPLHHAAHGPPPRSGEEQLSRLRHLVLPRCLGQALDEFGDMLFLDDQ